MKFDHKYTFLILVSFLLVLILNISAVVVSSDCLTKCGNIKIPYPFGISNKDCYLNDDYKIDCLKNSKGGKYPILSKFNMTVVNISLPEGNYGSFTYAMFGSVRVKIPITSRGCSSDGKETGSPLNLTGSPYFVDTDNYLVGVGCKSKLSLTNIEPNKVVCELNCTAKTEFHNNNIPFFDKTGCSNNTMSRYFGGKDCTKDKTSCVGNGCCLENIPYEPLQVIGIRIERTDENLMTTEECKVAFLTDNFNLLNGTKPEPLFAKGYTTVKLGWVIQTKNLSFLHSLSCKSKEEYENHRYDGSSRKMSCICDNITISENIYASCGCNDGRAGLEKFRAPSEKINYSFRPQEI